MGCRSGICKTIIIIALLAGCAQVETPTPTHVAHELRPGSPEWRDAQYDSVDLQALPEWSISDAVSKSKEAGHREFYQRYVIRGVNVWLQKVEDDTGNLRLIIGASPPVARYVFDS